MLKRVVSLLGSGIAFIAFTASATLPTRYEAEMSLTEIRGQNVRDLRPVERMALEGFDFVLVDGILGDLTQSLYAEVEVFLKAQLPGAQIQIIRPSSFLGLEDNAKALAWQLRPGKRPRIMLAHSRGAAEVFLALLKNPELLSEQNLARVVLVQGAFSGSPVADWTADLVDRGCHRTVNSKIVTSVCDFVDLFAPSLNGLRSNDARTLRTGLQRALGAETKALFQERVSFVRSRVSLGKAPMSLKPSALYLGHYYSAFDNDGILLTMQQRVPGFGQDLGILEADHLRLLGTSRKGKKDSSVFIRSLLAELVKGNIE
jgi:pimeloyl-ACP methyl ester carboxylesterase